MLVVVFRAQVRQFDDEYATMAAEMRELALRQFGCLEFHSVTQGDQEVALSYWPDEHSIRAWRNHRAHVLAQQSGRDRWYERYSVQVAEITREYRVPMDGADLRYCAPRLAAAPEEAAAVSETATTRLIDPSLVSYTHWMYALHALAAVIGITSPAFIATAFVFGIPSIIAVIMNYVRRGEVRGTWLDSHFSWQLRTFWFAALWIVVIGVVCTPLILLFGLGLILMWIGIAFVGLWILYRVIRGWLALKDGRTV